jgi:hypothetical protein
VLSSFFKNKNYWLSLRLSFSVPFLFLGPEGFLLLLPVTFMIRFQLTIPAIMKHNERARVAPPDFAFLKDPLRLHKKKQYSTRLDSLELIALLGLSTYSLRSVMNMALDLADVHAAPANRQLSSVYSS